MLRNIYHVIESVGKDMSNGRDLNFFSFLGGVIWLANVDENTINEHFEEQEDRDDIAQCRRMVQDLGLSDDMVSETISKVLYNAVCLDREVDVYNSFIKKFLNENSEPTLSNFLKAALEAWGEEFGDLLSGKISVVDKNKRSMDNLSGMNSELYQYLNDNVRGQSEAIRLFVQGLFQGEILSTKNVGSRRPRNVFLLSGPVGSGKSSLAEKTAKALGRPYLEIDLNEYSMEGPDAAEQLFAPIIDVKDGPRPGKVTYFADSNPQGFIIFKNLEHMNPKVITRLSEILDTGFIGKDIEDQKVVPLIDNTIIFTATLGGYLFDEDHEKNVSVLPQPMILELLKEEISQRDLISLLQEFFDRHFSANNIIMMNYVSLYHLSGMVQDTFDTFAQKMKETYGLVIDIDSLVTNIFLYTQSDDSNAHATVHQAGNFLKNEIYEFSRHLGKSGNYSFAGLESISFKVKPPENASPVRALLVNETVSEILVVADKSIWQGVTSGPSFNCNFAKDYDEALDILRQKDIKFCIVDLFYKQEGNTQFLSLDDVSSVGLECFEKLRREVEGLPFYVVDRNNMDKEDKVTFLQRGVRGFVVLKKDTRSRKTKMESFVQETLLGKKAEEHLQGEDFIRGQVDFIVQNVYAQGKRSMLNAKNKVLTFNSAQEISEDGKHATITFYDFSTRGTNLEGCNVLYDSVVYHSEGCLDDYIGSEAVKKELKHLSSYLVSPRQFVINEGAAPGGILLFGSEGVGKSVLAKYLAAEVDATLVAPEINSVQFLESGYLEAIFKVARKCAPSVIFINHLDRIGLDDTNNGEKLRNVIRQNLLKINKDVQHPVLFVGAMDFDDRHLGRDNTNLDVPLLNQLDYKINVPLPDKEQRKEFLQKLLRRAKGNTVSVDALDNIVQRSIWMTFDDLEEFFKVSLRTAKRENSVLNDDIFVGALDEFAYGSITERDEKLHWEVAIHEAGHAYMQWKSGTKSSFATITPRGDYGGYVAFKIDDKETARGTKEELLWKIRTAMASRAAEIIFLGRERGINIGISSDFRMATDYALNIVCWYGMDDDWLVSMPPEVMLRSALAGDVMRKVNNLLKAEFQNTLMLIAEGKKSVEALAKALLDKNQLTGKEIDTIIEQVEGRKISR